MFAREFLYRTSGVNMQQYQGQQPLIILKEGTERTQGHDAQYGNIAAARAVAQALRTTLGPKGMDKMIVDTIGDVVITNDGSTILEEMAIEQPAAKLIVEVAKTQDAEVGDGTTTAVILAGELLKRAGTLIEQDVHPTLISHGFRMAADKAHEVMGEIAFEVAVDDRDLLIKIAQTAMTGKGAEGGLDHLSDLVVRATTQVADDGKADPDFIKIERKSGASIATSGIIDGIIIDKERLHPLMPNEVKDAKILLLNTPIEYKKTETDAEITITSHADLQLFLDEEERMVREKVDGIIDSGANVLFCQKGIDEMAQLLLAKAGILAVRRVKNSDLKKLSRATGASLFNSVKAIDSDGLGYAEQIKEQDVGGDTMIAVTGCRHQNVITILLRGGTKQVVDELARAVEDAIRAVCTALEEGAVVPGGGAAEIETSLALRSFARNVGGREQLAIDEFAKALEIIPSTLAENAGHDPIDACIALRQAHEGGQKGAGYDINNGSTADMIKEGVIEPLKIKTQALASAAEAAIMVLRIDDIIAASSVGGEGEMPPEMAGMPPGMPGMGGMGGMPPMM